MSKNCNDKKGFKIDELFEVIPNGETIKLTLKHLNPEIVKQIETNLGLILINEKEAAGEVCFANNKEIRSDYKQSFTSVDLLNYCYAFLHSSNYHHQDKDGLDSESPYVPYPMDANIFWELVALGNNFRQIHLPEGPTS